MGHNANEKMLLRILDSIPAHIYWKDLNGVHLGCNASNARAANLRASEDIVGKTDYELSWKDRADNIVASDKKVLAEEREIFAEDVIVLPGETKETTFSTRKMPLYDENGELAGIIGVSLDITELKDTQKKMESALDVAKQAEEKRKEFVRNQAHDINTSIAGIVYAGYEIEATSSLEEAQSVSPRIRLCAKRLQDYNRSLLRNLTWLDDEGRVINQRTDLRDILTQLYDLNVLAAESKNLVLIVDKVSDDVPLYFMADELVIFQCLQNMVTNAIKFTQEGNVTISLKLLKVRDDSTAVVAFHVKDTGRGIDPESIRYIFDDYYKALPSNQADKLSGQQADEDKGRGLGLTLSKKQAAGMSGEIHLKWTEVNKGAEFVLTLPLKIALNQEP